MEKENKKEDYVKPFFQVRRACLSLKTSIQNTDL